MAHPQNPAFTLHRMEDTKLLRLNHLSTFGRTLLDTADHAVTIAERVQFMVTGTHPVKPTVD